MVPVLQGFDDPSQWPFNSLFEMPGLVDLEYLIKALKPFNSLFEMRGTPHAYRDPPQPALSILYLRCTFAAAAFTVWRVITFNSLFEMQRHCGCNARGDVPPQVDFQFSI